MNKIKPDLTTRWENVQIPHRKTPGTEIKPTTF